MLGFYIIVILCVWGIPWNLFALSSLESGHKRQATFAFVVGGPVTWVFAFLFWLDRVALWLHKKRK